MILIGFSVYASAHFAHRVDAFTSFNNNIQTPYVENSQKGFLIAPKRSHNKVKLNKSKEIPPQNAA